MELEAELLEKSGKLCKGNCLKLDNAVFSYSLVPELDEVGERGSKVVVVVVAGVAGSGVWRIYLKIVNLV